MTAAERLRTLVKEATGGEPWGIYEEPHHGRDDDPKWTERYVTEGGVLLNYEPGDIPLRKAQLIALAPQLAELVADMGEALEQIAYSQVSPTYGGGIHAAKARAREALTRLDALFSEEDK